MNETFAPLTVELKTLDDGDRFKFYSDDGIGWTITSNKLRMIDDNKRTFSTGAYLSRLVYPSNLNGPIVE